MRCTLEIACLLTTISVATGDFGYSRRDQHLWSQKYKSCAGKQQSPIAITSSKCVSLPLPALETIGYHNLLPGPVSLKNNGHSVALTVNKNSPKQHLPYIFGAAFKTYHVYEMDHLHFHWGAKNNRGSEHTLNGVRFPMEMHIVHKNRAYVNLSNALNYGDGVAVVGIFFQSITTSLLSAPDNTIKTYSAECFGHLFLFDASLSLQEDDNELLNPITNQLTSVRWVNEEVKLNVSLSLASLMPKNVDAYYTYKGSLTTPPCSEAVTWVIFPTPVPISFRQITKFRTISNGEDVLVDNFRRLQDIGFRKVYVRRLYPSLVTKYNSTLFNITNLSWVWQ